MEQELERLRRESVGIANTTAHFMRLAEKYADAGKIESAKACLVLLCEKCDNYEDSLEWNGLTASWLKHRHLVEGLVKPSLRFNTLQPLPPRECTLQIAEILALPDDELLSALSVHLSELSGGGTSLNCLNKWERTAYYVDELCMEVNSGGFDSYLYYHGMHFNNAFKAIEVISAPNVLALLDAVRSKFPRKRIPKTEDALQKAMDAMEEQGVDFEQEDACFYSSGERELLDRLLSFVLENQKHFR